MLELGTTLPKFRLPDATGKMVGDEVLRGKRAALVLFICNHCPYVKHIRSALAALAREYLARDVGIVAINSNDVTRYADDSPVKMAREQKEAGYVFPYLFDETQEVAKTFRAACTPDIFLFDSQQRLVYRGRFDATRPSGSAPATGDDLRSALDAVLAGRPLPAEQKPSMGCSIKWKPGNEPDYAGA
jgi:thiol-disulfide isomerase/thioredoxin